MEIIMEYLLEVILAIIAGVQTYAQLHHRNQRNKEREQHREKMAALEHTLTETKNGHAREIQELKNEAEQSRQSSEQHKALTEIVHTTITSSNSVVKSVNDLVVAMNETRLESLGFRSDMKGIIETLGLQLGRVDTTSKRTEQVVTEHTSKTLQNVEAIVRNNELVVSALDTLTKRIESMAEIQDSHVESATERHKAQVEQQQQTRVELQDGFKSIVGALHTIQKVVESNNAIIQRIQSPTQPLPVTPVTPDTVTHADDDAA